MGGKGADGRWGVMWDVKHGMDEPTCQSVVRPRRGMLEGADSYWNAMWNRRGDLSVALWVPAATGM